MSRWQEPFGPGRPGDERLRQEREREGRIEAAIRKSERDRIVAWLRDNAPSETRLHPPWSVLTLAEMIERGEHWKEQ